MKKILLTLFVLCGFAVQVNAMDRSIESLIKEINQLLLKLEQIENDVKKKPRDIFRDLDLSEDCYLQLQSIDKEEMAIRLRNMVMTDDINRELLQKNNKLKQLKRQLRNDCNNDNKKSLAYTNTLKVRKELLLRERKNLTKEQRRWKTEARMRQEGIDKYFFKERARWYKSFVAPKLCAMKSVKMAEFLKDTMNRE